MQPLNPFENCGFTILTLRNSINKLIALWPWLAAILSGVLYACCFAPFNQSWLCWIALSPLVIAVWFSGQNSRHRWLRNLLLGYVAGMVFFTIVFGWLGSLGTLYQNVFLHGLSWLLSIYLGVYLAFWAWFIGLIAPANFLGSYRNLQSAFLAAAAWSTQEWVRGWLFSGFGWNELGAALHSQLVLIQVARFTGVAGLSFIVAFASIIAVAAPVRLYLEAQSRHMRPHFDVTLTLATLVGLCTFGLYTIQNRPPTKPLRVAAIQPNVPQTEKADPSLLQRNFDQLSRLTEIALHATPAPEIVIWPESALPNGGPIAGFVRHVSELTSAEIDLMLGADDSDGQRVYNAAALVTHRSARTQIYHKIHLVPFGEYIPLRHSFPPFARIAGQWVPGDFDRGTDYTVFELSDNKASVAPLICFEDTIGDLTRRFVLNGADLLVNITNDGWFLHSAGSRQHQAEAVFRCIETARPMVRAANTGVTCFINDFGRITQILQDETGSTFTEGVLNGEMALPQEKHLTFYVRHGELFAQVCAGITLAVIVICLIRSAKSA